MKEVKFNIEEGQDLLGIERVYPEVPAELDEAILKQAGMMRHRARRNFFIRHVVQYTALAAAVCLCCLAPFYFSVPDKSPELTSTRTIALWDWKNFETSLTELGNDIDKTSYQTQAATTNYYGGELTLDTVIESINYYEVIL